MLTELQNLLPEIPSLLDEFENSLLIDKYPPIIHRVSRRISNTRTLLLHRLFNTHKEHALMHSHSWPFACKVIKGGYEMGVGFSSDRNKPPKSIFKSFVKTGDIYEMLSPDIWHYTKPTEDIECSYSILLIGERCRERRAENNSPLSISQKKEVIDWFRKELTK